MWHSSDDINIRRFEDTNQQSKIGDYIFKITLRCPMGNELIIEWDIQGPVQYRISIRNSLYTQFTQNLIWPKFIAFNC